MLFSELYYKVNPHVIIFKIKCLCVMNKRKEMLGKWDSGRALWGCGATEAIEGEEDKTNYVTQNVLPVACLLKNIWIMILMRM